MSKRCSAGFQQLTARQRSNEIGTETECRLLQGGTLFKWKVHSIQPRLLLLWDTLGKYPSCWDIGFWIKCNKHPNLLSVLCFDAAAYTAQTMVAGVCGC